MSKIIYQVKKDIELTNPLTPYQVHFRIITEDEKLKQKLINYAEMFPYSIRPCYTIFNKLCVEFHKPSYFSPKLEHNLKDYLTTGTIFKFKTEKEMNQFHLKVALVVHQKINKVEESYIKSVETLKII